MFGCFYRHTYGIFSSLLSTNFDLYSASLKHTESSPPLASRREQLPSTLDTATYTKKRAVLDCMTDIIPAQGQEKRDGRIL